MSKHGIDHNDKGVPIQGPKSQNAMFPPNICRACNNDVTSEHDRAYSKFSDRLAALMDDEVEPDQIRFEAPWSIPGHVELANLFRYFAKMLGCHAAAIQAPIPVKLPEFILGADHTTRFSCQVIKRADAYSVIKSAREEEQFSHIAHNGLALMFSKKDKKPTGLQSGISINWAHITYSYEFELFETVDLEWCFAEFLESARVAL